MISTVLDIETSGFHQGVDKILEVGFIRIDDDCNIVKSGSLFFWQPGWKVGPTHVHHLTEDFLAKYTPEFEKNVAGLYAMMYSGVIIGKNSDRFDIPFIQAFLRDHATGCDCSYYEGSPFNPLLTYDVQDIYAPKYRKWVAEKTGVYPGDRKKGNLEDYMEMLGHSMYDLQKEFREKFPDCPREGYHSALFDAYMTYLAFKDVVDKGQIKIGE